MVTSAERARSLAKPPVWVLGTGSVGSHTTMSEWSDFTRSPAAVSGRLAFERAGLTAADVDVCQLYDAFTILLPMTFEALGFCERGDGGPFVAGNRLQFDGAVPTNTDGGGLSACHAGMRGVSSWSRRCDSSAARPTAVRCPAPRSRASTALAVGSRRPPRRCWEPTPPCHDRSLRQIHKYVEQPPRPT